jgi:NSS family neurotransmitter:Na+ symporter
MSKDSWGSRVGLILAMAGNAVGLGNFLRFPVKAIQNGGGAFIIPYLTCFILLGIPLLFVEWGLGRYGGRFGNHSTPFIFDSVSKKNVWKYVGVFGIFCNIGIASYYCYIESWTMTYIVNSIIGTFNGHTSEQVATYFNDYTSLKNPIIPIFSWIACLLLNTYILSRGLSGGVEKVAKVGMPLLIIFGILLAIQGITLKAGTKGAILDGTVGLNFLWTPNFDTIWQPKVWLAAAGQVFFTLSVGMGSIQCYASYVNSKDDIALNAMSAGWMNEFVEVLLGASIIIPISVGYLGIDKVVELTQNGGLGLGFKTLPFLFTNWGVILGAIAGVMWFGLLFFAGITSSLAMGTPCISFLEDEFNFSKNKAAFSFGLAILILGLPTILFFNYGVFDEYDYWAGDVSLFIFAMLETILFVWVFGINNAWKEVNTGADIKIPIIFKYIMKYITPILLIIIFLSSIPEMFNKIIFSDIRQKISETTDIDAIAEFKTQMLYMTGSRILLVCLFIGIAYLVFKANNKRKLKTQTI